MTMTLKGMREKYPQYDDLSDEQLVDAFHKKFYSDMPKAKFNVAIGYHPPAHDVPEYDPGVKGYNAKTGNIEKSGMEKDWERIGAFSTGGVEGLPIVGPTIEKGLRGVAAGGASLATGEPFGEVYDDMGRRVTAAQNAQPTAATAGRAIGALLGTGATVTAAPALFGAAPGQALGTQVLRGGISSGLLGGGDVAARGGTPGEIASGAALSAALGGASPLLVQGATMLGRTAGGMLGLGNQGRAENAVAEALLRSGQSADDVSRGLAEAASEGQGVYTVADQLGNSGQRMLSGVTRSPGDKRQAIVDALDSRQAGQGRRIAGFLEEGFGAPQTAAQTEAATKALRSAEGNANYGAARAAAGPVDVTPAIEAIDNIIQPGVTPIAGGTDIADNGVYSTLSRARKWLTDGRSQISDFNRGLLAKQEMDALIENGGTVAAKLRPVRDALDEQLAQASKPYAQARDAYRQRSLAIEAVDTGRNAARRGRVEDTVPRFNGLSADEQTGFRAGYVDPLIESTQGAAVGVNKARPLINDATAVEFPAFAQPGRADRLGRQLARENTMFETRGAATGGSRTADNLADMADVGSFDPSMIGSVLSGNWSNATKTALAHAANSLQGRNQATRDMIADVLMQTSPTRAAADLANAVRRGEQLTRTQAGAVQKMLLGVTPVANAPKYLSDR